MITRPAHPLRLLIAVLMAACAACALQETTPVKPTSDGGERMGESQERSKGPMYGDPQLTVSREGQLYLLWTAVEARKSWDIMFSRSTDSGVTWSQPPVSLKSEKVTAISGLRMAGDPRGRLSVVWREVGAARHHDLSFTHSENGGGHWGEGKRSLKASTKPGPPHLLVDKDGGVLVAWLDGPKNRRFLQVVNSYSAGATFVPDPIRLNAAFPTSEYGITNPRFTSDGEGQVYVVWEESKTRSDVRIYLNRSLDRGQAWQMQPILVSTPEEGEHHASKPQIIAAPKGRVYIVWEEFEGRKVNPHRPEEVIIHDRKLIYFNRSLDYGQTWLPRPIRLNGSGSGPVTSFVPQLSGDQSGRVYVAWMESEGSSPNRLLFARSSDSGLTWSDPMRLDPSSPFGGLLAYPEIRNDDAGHVWVLWQEMTPDRTRWQLLVNRSDETGLTWRPRATPLASSPQQGETYRDVSFEHDGNGRLYAAWDGGPKNVREIYFNRSADFGATWLSREVQVGQR